MSTSDGVIQVEKGVQLPQNKGLKYPFRNMEIGDSIFINKPRGYVATMAYSVAKRIGIKVSTREENGGTRVWRVA